MKAISIRLCFLGILLGLVSCGADNPQLTPLSPSSTILAFGDSLTYGTGASKDRSYPSVLNKLAGIKIINDGVPGEITAEGKTRLLKSLKKHQPNLVILCHGGNDMIRKLNMQQVKNNLDEMISMIRESGSEVILLAVPRPGILLKPAPFYKVLADQHKLPLQEDILSKVLSSSNLKSDPAHPNGRGYLQIAISISQLLLDAQAISKVNVLE